MTTNIKNLIPLTELSNQKIRELFNKNPNFAWNVRHYVENDEAEYIQDVFNNFGEAKVDWEFGLYTTTRFRVNHDSKSLEDFAAGCTKIAKDYGFFFDEDAKFIKQLISLTSAYLNNEDPETEDDDLERAYVAMDEVANIIKERVSEIFDFWESDENILNERLNDFVDYYGDKIYLNPANDELLELTKIKFWEF